MSGDFQGVLDQLRSNAETEYEKGHLFERLMKRYFQEDPIYKDRFANVLLWPEWAEERSGFTRKDTGIDLVAEEHDGGVCAIQCKFYAPSTRLSKPHLDSFISASARDPFTARILVDTSDEVGINALETIDGLKPACQVLSFNDLANQPIDWPNLIYGEPENLSFRHEPYELRPHQKEAFDNVIQGFTEHDRGKMIMASGTGKTFTALRIAEHFAGVGGRVLYLVPSISLLQQSMREWATQREVPHRYIGICSDIRAGHKNEDAALEELEIPVTTDPVKISGALQRHQNDVMTVAFCTYHSLPIVEKAQNGGGGAPEFDIILCDEAHRTTGIERPDDKTSPFVLVHDGEKIGAKKRLYMTATPRLYTEGAKTKAATHDIDVFSMDDPETYGPEFHRLPFSKAIERNLLSDYKVVIFALSEEHISETLQALLATIDGEINISDAAKIVGCWRALQNPENKISDNASNVGLSRAIAYTNTIAASKRLTEHWERIVEHIMTILSEEEQPKGFHCETRHVDGRHHALDRKKRIEWLKGSPDGSCRILSNARCLSEGIDVPALDAVLFMNPRNSYVDIVQAVGRIMRKARGKKYGYVVLPIAVPPGVDPAEVLEDNERFAVVWAVLRALRSHDDRLNAKINQIEINKKPTGQVTFLNNHSQIIGGQLSFPFVPIPLEAIYAKIVEKCGDPKYWETWAKDVADIFSRLVTRIESLLHNTENQALHKRFKEFHKALQSSINKSISHINAVEMMAQHILTRPIFEALFEHYEFTANNPVACALDGLGNDLRKAGLESETRDLEPFYESVRMRVQDLKNSAERHHVLMELYEKFFATAMKKDAERLGIVYTPVEVVDFILNSADQVLQNEFGMSISDKDVRVLDPFTGTGIFLVRLLRSEPALVRDSDLERKYRQEMYANEIVLLAYYIATIHIEEAFHERCGLETDYKPFEGIAFTDTFNLHRSGFSESWLPDNSARVKGQQQASIQVIVGNPPWSAGQRSSADDNPNVDYPEIEKRVAETYAIRSSATLKNSLYDMYKMAIRWASDRIGEQGIVAFVTNGSWIDSIVDSGIRACLVDEFTSIYVVNLRGNQRTQGERSRREGGKVFGSGSRAPVAITILVRNPNATHGGCRILYKDIGDGLNREKKLAFLREAESVDGIEDWEEITPDKYHDWVGQRDEAFQHFYPVGSKEAKADKTDKVVFKLFSRGYATSRDAYTYNFSREACAMNARAMIEDYMEALRELSVKSGRADSHDVDDIARRHSAHVRWDLNLKNNLRRGKKVTFSPENIWTTQYRPFVKQHCYVDYVLANSKYQLDKIFPSQGIENRAICVPGIGSNKPFSALVVDTMPDLGLMSACQCFPRYRYDSNGSQGKLLDFVPDSGRVDNITDTALRTFREHYNDETITKDDIFDYVYGILHSPRYSERFTNDLAKSLPRIPFAPDFLAFATAGQKLAKLHLNYETCKKYPLEIKPESERFQLSKKAMRFKDDEKTILRINERVSLYGIPEKAHMYSVNGRTPLEWFIDRYKITQDKKSGIVNDPNDWFSDPENLVHAIQRIVYVSVETVELIADLPEPFEDLDDKKSKTLH